MGRDWTLLDALPVAAFCVELPMSDEDALLNAIYECPEDDTLRLAYADCLQESGDEAKCARAELIRLQCRVERDPVLRDILKRRVRHLLGRWRVAWAAGLSPLLKRANYCRGFPFPEMKPKPQQFLEMTAANLAGAPRWEIDVDWAADPRFPEVVASPLFARFSGAFFSCSNSVMPEENVVALARSPHARALRGMHIVIPPGGGGLREMAASESLVGLTSYFWPRGNDQGPDAIRVLASARFAPNLESLTLQEGLLTSDAAAVFAGAPFPQLRSLSLLPRYNERLVADRTALFALLRSETLRNVRNLSIGDGIGVTDAVAQAIADSPVLSNLYALHLGDSNIGEAGALALAKSSGLGGLKHVGLHRAPCARSERAVAALRARFPEVSF